MPMHYDTIEAGQNKTSHFLFSKPISELNPDITIREEAV